MAEAVRLANADPARAARAIPLQVARRPDGTWLVTGGSAPHSVDAQVLTCDCADHRIRNALCKHLIAVRLRADELAGEEELRPGPLDDLDDLEEEEAAEPPRFRLLRLADVEKLPDPTYLVHGVVPEGSTMMLYGAPGDGKTFLALDLALTIATGCATWFGRAVKAGRVVYLAAEGLAGLKRRIQAWGHAHAGQSGGLIQFVGEPVQLLQVADVAQLTRAIDSFSTRAPALIVLDTLSRCTPGGDENSVQDTSLAVRSVDYLRRYYGATVLLIHHTQKAGDLERGSGNWRAAVDVMLHVRNDDAVRELRSTKVRDGAPLESLRFVLRPTLESCIIATPDPTDDSRMTPNQKDLLALLEKLTVGENPVTATVWLKASGLPERTFYNSIAALQDRGLVKRLSKGYVLTPVGRMELQLQRNCQATANA